MASGVGNAGSSGGAALKSSSSIKRRQGSGQTSPVISRIAIPSAVDGRDAHSGGQARLNGLGFAPVAGSTPHYEIQDPMAGRVLSSGSLPTPLDSANTTADINVQAGTSSILASLESQSGMQPSSSKPQLSPLVFSEEPSSIGSTSPASSSHAPGSGFRETAKRLGGAESGHYLSHSLDRGRTPISRPISRADSADVSHLRNRVGSPTQASSDYDLSSGNPSRRNSDGVLLKGQSPDAAPAPSISARIDRLQEEDDELYKGHSPTAATFSNTAYIDDKGMPKRRSSLGHHLWSAVRRAVSPTSPLGHTGHQHHPLVHTVVGETEDGRKTPARYRPQTSLSDRKGKGKMSLQLDTAPRISLQASSLRREAWATNGTPSPAQMHHNPLALASSSRPSFSSTAGGVMKPQARRGAINLKRPQRRPIHRRTASTTDSSQNQRNAFVSLFFGIIYLIRLILWAIIRPHTALRLASQNIRHAIRSTDLAFRDPRTGRRVWKPEWLDAYIPLIIWLGISLSSTALVITFHEHVFTALDHLASTLRGWGLAGKVALGGLIFLTTFPPLPLYSTLIILGGFTFGLWQGFIIAYGAALLGAITVFSLSRTLLRSWMESLLLKSGGLQKVIRAIEKQPRLLFLIRLAPYPYNLMNTLLASSSTLTLRTYTICTALALPKLLVHCGLGTSIKNFADYKAGNHDPQEKPSTAERAKTIFGFVGVALCIGIFIHLLQVARRAVDELEDEDAAYEELDITDSDEEEWSDEEDDEEAEDRIRSDEDIRLKTGRRTPAEAASPWRFDQPLHMQQHRVGPGPDMQELPGSGRESVNGSHHGSSFDRPILLQIEDMEASAEDYDFGRHLHRQPPSRR